MKHPTIYCFVLASVRKHSNLYAIVEEKDLKLIINTDVFF